jgi:phage terminase Nu1 subunit (DNA packaging protein)
MVEKIAGRALAQLIGVHERTIRDLADAGHVVKLGKATYDRDASILAYCTHLRETAAGRGGAIGVATLTAERARLAREQADSAALKNAALRGDTIAAADVKAKWVAILTAIRSRILSVPSRVRMRAPHLTRAEIEIVDAELRDALEEAAHG